MTAPQYGHRSYYAPPEGIAVTAKYNTAFGTFLDFFKPQIYVDGIEAPVMGWGRTTVPAAAGRHDVHVPPGEYVELEYRAPVFTFSRGSLGPPPQRYHGVWPVVALLGGAVLLIAILLLLG